MSISVKTFFEKGSLLTRHIKTVDHIWSTFAGATTFCLSASPDANPKEALLAAGLWEESMMLEGPISFVSRSADGWYTFPATF